MKIKTFKKLVKELKRINKKYFILEELYNLNGENALKCINNISVLFYENNKNLSYLKLSNFKVILEKPTYDEVYDFCYNYYICSLALNKDKYKSLNKIFRRKYVK